MGSTRVCTGIYRRCVRSFCHHPPSGPVAPLPLHRELPHQPVTDDLSDCVPSLRRSPLHSAAVAKAMAAEHDPACAGHSLPGDRLLADVGRLYRRRRRDPCDIPDDAEHVGLLWSRHCLSGVVGEVPGAPQQLWRLSGPGHRNRPGSGVASRDWRSQWRLLPFSAPNSRGRLSSSVCRFSVWYCWMRGLSCSCFWVLPWPS